MHHNRSMVLGLEDGTHHIPAHMSIYHDVVLVVVWLSILVLIMRLMLLMIILIGVLIIIFVVVVVALQCRVLLARLVMWVSNHRERMMRRWTVIRALIAVVLSTHFEDPYS